MTFTEKQIDGAALLVSASALGGLPKNIAEFLTQSQLTALEGELREAVKTSLLFSLMNHLDEESFA